MITKKFIRNSIIYTIAGSLPMASAIILLPFYLGYLSLELYGSLSIYMGISLLVQIFVTFSFDTSVYTYFHIYKPEIQKLASYISTSFNFILIVGLMIIGLSSITGSLIFERVFKESQLSFFPFGFIAVITGIFQAVFKVNNSLLQTQEKASEFLLMNLVSFSLTALLSVAGLLIFPDSLLGPLVGRLLAFFISSFWVIITVYSRYGKRFNPYFIKEMFGFNGPNLGYQILQWVNSYFDRPLMASFLPLSQIGLYDLAAKILLGIEFILTGVYNSFYPRVIGVIALQHQKKSTIEVNRYYNGLTAVAIIMVAISILFLPLIIDWIVLIFDKPGYLFSVPLIPLVAATYLLRSLRLYVVMPYAAVRYTGPLPFYYLAITIIKISLIVFFVRQSGIVGVIYATWISYVCEIFILYLGIRTKFLFSFNLFKMVIAPGIMIGSIVVFEPMFGREYPLLLHAVYLILAAVLLSWSYRNELLLLAKDKSISKLIKD